MGAISGTGSMSMSDASLSSSSHVANKRRYLDARHDREHGDVLDAASESCCCKWLTMTRLALILSFTSAIAFASSLYALLWIKDQTRADNSLIISVYS
jgi:hypothetical protein